MALPTPVLGSEPPLGLPTSLSRLRDEFVTRFGGSAAGVRTYFSPGRVNMFGGHLDYNGGPVLPVAIDRGTFLAIRRAGDQGPASVPGSTPGGKGRVRLATVFGNDVFDGTIDALPAAASGKWYDYPIGVIRALLAAGESGAEGHSGVRSGTQGGTQGGTQRGTRPPRAGLDAGFDVLYGGNLPVGAGLSSSASITVGTAFALDSLFELGLEPMDRVAAALDAERGYVGVQCGIMDPFAVGFAREKQVLWLDCKDESFEHLPLDFKKLSIGVMDTGVQRALARGEFNRRVAECKAAFEALKHLQPGATVLRDVPLEIVEAHAPSLDPDVGKRALHVAREVARTFRAREAFLAEDFVELGKAMTETHRSFQTHYECSCEELDVLVDAAVAQDGVFGSRLTGAGFGGCIVMLVAAGSEADVSRAVADVFEVRYGRRPPAAFFQGDAGPREIQADA